MLLVALDEFAEDLGSTGRLDEAVLEEIFGGGALGGVLGQAEGDKVLEGRGEVALEDGRVGLRNEEEDSHSWVGEERSGM